MVIRSNKALCQREFLRAKPEGIPKGEGLYLTVDPESSPNTDSIIFYEKFGIISLL